MDEEIKNQIFSTRDYDKFKFMKGNRPVDIRRIQKITKSIEDNGYITSPILVNENYEIIDGQGRYEALKRLGMPIEYIVQNGLTIKECVAMNIYQTNWKLRDYIKSYADIGNENFIRMQMLMDEYPTLRDTSIIAAATKGVTRFAVCDVSKGVLTITEEDYEKAKENLEWVLPLHNLLKTKGRATNLITGALICTFLEGVDRDKLMRKLTENFERNYVPSFGAIPDVIQYIEQIYNYGCRDYVYIFTEYRKRVKEQQRKAAERMLDKNLSLVKVIRDTQKSTEE